MTARSLAWRTPRQGPELRSFWLSEALAGEVGWRDSEALSGRVRTDVCIVGGGYTGLWTALELKRLDPACDVTIVEADVCGSGASGTNAGMLMNLWPKVPALQRLAGTEAAGEVAQASSDAVDRIVDFCNLHAMDADVRRSGWLWASTNASQDGAWEDTLAILARYPRSPFREVDEREASLIAGRDVRGGVVDGSAALVQPARLARGLAREARRQGVRVFERSPVVSVEGGSSPSVSTAAGKVVSDNVILATNAWCAGFAEIGRHLVLSASDNLVVKGRLEGQGPHAGVSDSGRLLDYWRPATSDTVLYGKGGVGLGVRSRGASTMFRTAPRQGRLRSQLLNSLPLMDGGVVISTWRAPVEYSLTSLPFFGPLEGCPGVFFGTGYSGDGIGPSLVGANVLVQLVMGGDLDVVAQTLTRQPQGRGLPPEPIRFLGGQLVKSALLREERLADAGRSADLPTRWIAGIDPTGFVG